MGNLSAAVQLKCPRCEKGQLYPNTGFLPQKGWFAMHTHCSECGLKYEKEIGFFYGAMYISYVLNIAFFVTAVVAYYLFFSNADWRYYIAIYVFITFLFAKMIYRLSRSIWLMIMIKYDPSKKEI